MLTAILGGSLAVALVALAGTHYELARLRRELQVSRRACVEFLSKAMTVPE